MAERKRSGVRAFYVGDDRPWMRQYDRKRDLPRLVPMLAADLETPSAESQARLIGMLRKALWRERQRARSRHWTYDPARHSALVRAYKFENALGPQRDPAGK